MTSDRSHWPALGKSLMIQLGGFALGLAVHMLLSRWLGLEGYGDLSVTLSVALFAATLALLGFDRSAAQTLSAYAADQNGPLATSFARSALTTVAVAALAVSLLSWGGTRLAEALFSIDEHPVRYAAALVAPMAFAMVFGGLMTGLRRPLASEILGQVSGRMVLLGLAAWALFGGTPQSERVAVGLAAIAWVVPAALLGIYLWRRWPTSWTPAAPTGGLVPSWRRTARSYLVALLPLVILEESGILLMELLHANEAAVGIYAAAHRTAGLPLIALAAARQLAVPELAVAFKKGHAVFEARLRPFLRFSVAAAVLAWLGFVVFGDEILALFGNASEQGHLILVLLGAACGVFLVSGLAAPVLQLHGEHRLVIGTMITLLCLSLIAGAAVVPRWGGEGLAAVFAAANVLVLGFMMSQVKRRTGVRYLGLLLPPRKVP